MKILIFVIIVILAGLLILSIQRNSRFIREREQLIRLRDTAQEIADKIVRTRDPAELYQFILEACMKLIPKAKYGSVFLFDPDGFLTAKASAGFSRDEISRFKMKLEESFLYAATHGKLDRAVAINRLEEFAAQKSIPISVNQGLVLRSEAAAPLRVNSELAGILCIDGDENGIFTEQDIHTLEYMANQIGIVIHNQKLHGEILRLSRYDSLTELLNRDSFEKEAEKLLNDPSKDAANLYYVLMDLDDMKLANDTNGHHFGDEVMKAFSGVIRRYLGKNDLFGRYGGDEFAAVIQGDHLYISHLLEDAKIEFAEKKIGLLTNEFIPGFTYGMACFQESDLNLDTLYKLADKRLQEAKSRNKKDS